MHMRYSTISPGLSDIGAQAPTNDHVERLGAVLLTYNFYDQELGTCVVLAHGLVDSFLPF